MGESKEYQLFCQLRQAMFLALREWAEKGAEWDDVREEIKATRNAMNQMFVVSR